MFAKYYNSKQNSKSDDVGNACREYDRELVSLLSVMFVQVDKRNMVILEA